MLHDAYQLNRTDLDRLGRAADHHQLTTHDVSDKPGNGANFPIKFSRRSKIDAFVHRALPSQHPAPAQTQLTSLRSHQKTNLVRVSGLKESRPGDCLAEPGNAAVIRQATTQPAGTQRK